MITGRTIRRRIGEILRESGLVSEKDLQLALQEQEQSNELLGQVLVRMGVLERGEVQVALSIQDHLGSVEQAVRLAAGVRQMLGALLVQAGTLSPQELEQAIAEQKERGGKLGEACVRLGFLSQRQLEGVLSFQEHQGVTTRPSPLRLGELLVTAGYIDRQQLADALGKQLLSGRKLGEVLVEEGYAHQAQVSHGMRLQQLLMKGVLAALLSLGAVNLTGCGSSGGTATAPVAYSDAYKTPSATAEAASGNYFTVTSDAYPMVPPTFLYSSDNASFWSIQANVAKSVTDIDAVGVVRIDIPKTAAPLPRLNQTFAIEEGREYQRFPGTFTVCNGSKSATKKVEKGTISFAPDSDAGGTVSGTFDVTLTDYDSFSVPTPQYRLKGAFRFHMNSYGPAPA